MRISDISQRIAVVCEILGMHMRVQVRGAEVDTFKSEISISRGNTHSALRSMSQS